MTILDNWGSCLHRPKRDYSSLMALNQITPREYLSALISHWPQPSKRQADKKCREVRTAQ